MSTHSRSQVLRAVFLLTIVTGAILNVFQLSKLKDQSRSANRRTQIDAAFSNPTTYRASTYSSKELVKDGDFVYSEGWDSAPIVIESHKLVFFTVPKAGCTIWKQLFRRMMGFDDWKTQSSEHDDRLIPHNPRHNGLKYLNQYPREKANEIMTSPDYIRAIFVRDPKERFLSAFLDKALSNDGSHIQAKCCPSGDCVKEAQTLYGFSNLVMRGCKNPHWDPQSRRMEPKYWKYIDFVGHLENAPEDAKRLLQEIGAWEEYGKSGWGPKGDKAIFESDETALSHATHSKWKLWKWYTPELENIVTNLYSADYSHPVLSFKTTKLY